MTAALATPDLDLRGRPGHSSDRSGADLGAIVAGGDFFPSFGGQQAPSPVSDAAFARGSAIETAESAPLLDYLLRHQVRPEFTCRFRWRPGSIAFWDNRCAQHNPINDYHGYRRLMHRITLAGDRPRGPHSTTSS